MNAIRFDSLTRSLSLGTSRRGILGSGLTVLGLAARLHSANSAKRRRRHKRRKRLLRRNEFGCVPVGKPCRGKDRNCCSGICHGKRPKKGKRDTSRCVGHDVATCQPGEEPSYCGGTSESCTTTLGMSGVCNTTTGNAGFCSTLATFCVPPCATDADCQAGSGNSRAACVLCARCPSGIGCSVPGPPYPVVPPAS